MKIKTAIMSYKKVLALPVPKRIKPKKPNPILTTLIRLISIPELAAVKFKNTNIGMEKLGKKEPCIILMNHSSFIDLKIASKIFYPRPYNIICTSDGFVGKNLLMQQLGCIPTNKFVTDTRLVKDMLYAVRNLKTSILMYPEASYSFDGTATSLPEGLGKCIKVLGVPLIIVNTHGAFLRDPLYNGLRLRKVQVTSDTKYVLSPEDIAKMSVEEINSVIKAHFSFDYFAEQQEKKIRVDEHFRAEGLNRVLYKCPHCLSEGKTVGKDTELYCTECGIKYRLTEFGALECLNGGAKFNHIPDWYAWQRECVKNELLDGTYRLDTAVDILMMVNTKKVYKIGKGRLLHSPEGFLLTGCEGELEYTQKPLASHSLYSDYFWYEIGDIICIGDNKKLFYCLPKCGDVVAKTRLAAEELYKIAASKK